MFYKNIPKSFKKLAIIIFNGFNFNYNFNIKYVFLIYQYSLYCSPIGKRLSLYFSSYLIKLSDS